MALIAPSILSADFSKLREEVEMINRSEADWFHVDVMDGVFVPNISFGFPVIKQVKKYATKPLDVHLMIVQPERYVQEFKDAGADILTVHIEASTHLHRTLQMIKAAGMQAGVAVNPHTAINQLEDIITDVDLVCLMSVNPGFGGQKFIPGTFSKLEKLRKLIDSTGSKARIEIDGGVGSTNAAQLINTGADVLVAGNFVFSAADPVGTIAGLKKL